MPVLILTDERTSGNEKDVEALRPYALTLHLLDVLVVLQALVCDGSLSVLITLGGVLAASMALRMTTYRRAAVGVRDRWLARM